MSYLFFVFKWLLFNVETLVLDYGLHIVPVYTAWNTETNQPLPST